MRLIARYASEYANYFEITTVYDTTTERERVPLENPVIQTLSHTHPAAIWFERKMHDDFGIIIEDAFDKRPLVHQEYAKSDIHAMRKSFLVGTKLHPNYYVPYNYEVVEGDGVFQVSVGPIHAGIIEPGHFHFSQAGEDMLHQEVRHFYKYRGIEKMLEGKTLLEAKAIIERISGNESIAYQIVWRDIYLGCAETTLDESLVCEHAFLLELERLIHHLTDLGFIPNDAGFAAALAYCSKLAEDARRMMKKVTGHRFGFGAITFESLGFDVPVLHEYLQSLQKDILFFEEWIMDIPSLWDRFDTTGILKTYKAMKYDTVGVVARASGVAHDRRLNKFYLQHGFEMANEVSGDVAARFKVRLHEVKNSLKMMQSFLKTIEGTNISLNLSTPSSGFFESYVESSIGELYMSVQLVEGVIERIFIRDASFMNWQALHLMMPGNIIADFPLINKSCDLSYAGNDL